MASNEVKYVYTEAKKGHRERWVRAAARSTARTQGIHTSSEEQQHKHGTAQASEQGAEEGGGVLT